MTSNAAQAVSSIRGQDAPSEEFKAATDSEWLGWYRFLPIAFEDYAGPFYVFFEEGRVVCGFRPRPDHANLYGNVHGGALMAFADYALSMIGRGLEREFRSLTVTFSSEFLSPARIDGLLTARGEITGGGRSLRFVRGTIYCDDQPVMAFSSTIKQLKTIG
ncbi:PaaI family thioesterase [Caulobacter segnis]|nr:PaaI family thioesterase [Caulobacter segnis]